MFPERLIAGYRSFLAGRLPSERSRFAALAEKGQRPEVMVIGCCDSRVSPEVIFDASPGELFVVRNVANLVPPYAPDGDYHGTSAALEFAVQALKVKHIVILGHARCGGIQAFAEGAAPLSTGDFIGKWMTIVAPAAERLGPKEGEDYLARLEQAAIAQSLDNLMTFPYVAERVAAGQLFLHGAYFGVATGVLLVRNPEDGTFAPAAHDIPAQSSV
ncbi:MAG: carbonic anhydrase [Pseudomonadota bacterium]|nr:carbonic anhydrase [Pseudomonadota bacterium]